MNNLRTPVQIVTVIFALTMLGAYVVYSQRQQMRNIASGSKSGFVATPETTTGLYTNQPAAHATDFVASSSKSRAPLIEVPAWTLSSNTSPRQAPALIAPGSKSLEPIIAVRQAPKRNSSANGPATTIAPGVKSQAPIFDFHQQQQLETDPRMAQRARLIQRRDPNRSSHRPEMKNQDSTNRVEGARLVHPSTDKIASGKK